MAQDVHPYDPRGLIREAYRIEGITPDQVIQQLLSKVPVNVKERAKQIATGAK